METRRSLAAYFLTLFLGACASGDGEVEVPVASVITLEVEDVDVTVAEDGEARVALVVTASEGTPEISIDTPPAHGKLTGSGLTYTYEPEADYAGADSVAFTAKVGDVEKSGRVTIAVTPVNDAPSFTPGVAVAVLEDSGAYAGVWATAIVTGPDDEAGQAPAFTVTHDNASLFAVAPGIAADGTLTFTPAANASGSAVVSVVINDDGGTAGGGADTAPAVTFTISVTPVNDRPVFTAGANIVVSEDSGAADFPNWASGIAAGPADEDGQSYAFAVTTNQPGLFAVAPNMLNDGSLSFTPAADANGAATLFITLTDDGGTANGGTPVSLVQTVTVTVTGVNDAPGFTAGGNISVQEDSGAFSGAWATNVSAGPANEAAQAVTFGVTTTNGALFAVQPALDASGTLTFTPAADANGAATVTVTAYDSGGTAGGGVSTSSPANFTLTVNAVNDAPSFIDAGNPVVAEDSGAVALNGWASSISAGPGESQGYAFTVTTNAPGLFASGPAVSNTGTLSFTPAADAFGAAQIYVTLQDDGGTANGGVDSSSQHVATITLTGVNDAPAFTAGGNVTVNEDSGAYSAAWATGISTGPANEAAQAVTFSVVTAQSAFFAVQPAVAPDGTLGFTPAADANGTATLDVRIHDDGGTAGGGVAASAVQTLSITINAVNDPPSFTLGAAPTVAEDSGPASIGGFAGSMSVGPADEAVQTYGFTVTTSSPALFAAAPALANDGTLTFTPAANAFGVARLYVTMTDSGSAPNASATQIDLTISAVNDAPAFAKGGNQVGAEDAGPIVVAGWATQISPGAGESEAVAFVVSNDNPVLFATAPTISADGTLAYETVADAYGAANVSVRLQDEAGAITAAQTFSINIVGVNDAPAYMGGGDQAVDEDAGPQVVAGWAVGLSAGPANEAWQTFSFTVTTTSPGLFAAAPAINAAGDLSYTPADDANGPAMVYVTMHDSGGTALGGQNSTAPQSFAITLNAVNDAPTFTAGGDKYALDTAGPQSYPGWAADISVGPADEGAGGQTYSFAVTNDANALFATQPSVDLSGTLTFEPAVGQSGTANVAVTLSDSLAASTLRTVRIVVDAMNDAPSFVTGGTVAVLEDAGAYAAPWATALSAGPGEAGQQLTFIVTANTNPALFAAQPAIAPDGTLAFTPAPDANGAAYVTVRLQDDGGTAGGGVDVSGDETFKIEVGAVNDKPGFSHAGDVFELEDAGAVLVAAWAHSFTGGAPDEAGQTLSFVVTADDPSLFTSGPAVDALGNLTFTPAPDAVGITQVEVKAEDDGDMTNGGDNTSEVITFTLTVGPVNDAPSFTGGGAVTIDEDDPTGVGQGLPWATNLSVGPADEVGQGYMFDVTSDNSMLVNSLWIDQNGWLYFWTNNDQWGTATVYVTMLDDGGMDDGGEDRTSQTFTLTVNPINDPPQTRPDALATAVDTPGNVGVLFNDWEPDGGPLTVTGYTTPAGGTLVESMGTFEYTPNPGFTGYDSFVYFASDGTLAVPGTVTVFVGPDTVPPAFLAASSNPQNGATLNFAQAMGAGIGGVPQLSPARFVFDDPFLDASSVAVAVDWQLVPLVEGVTYWVDRTRSGEVAVSVDFWAVPAPPEGAPLTFTLSNIADTYGNPAPDVVVSVWYDGTRPQADWLSSSWNAFARLVVQFDESLDPASVASFLAQDVTDMLPLAPDAVSGSAVFTLNKPNDAFYFVAGEPVPEGHDVNLDLSGFTDLAGNPAQGPTVGNYTVCCAQQTPIQLLAIEFVDRDTKAVTASFAPGALVNNAFMAPGGLAGGDDLVQMVFASSLDPASGYADLSGDEFKPDGLRVSGTYETTNLANDTVVFDPLGSDPQFVWRAGDAYQIQLYVREPGSFSQPVAGYDGTHTFAIKGGASDVTAPMVKALSARRGAGTVPVLRGEEELRVWFSETIDPATLVPANITLSGPSGSVPLLIELDGALSGLRLRAAGLDGKPGAWPAGDLTLALSGLQDTATPANTLAAVQFAVAVTPAAVPAPSMLHFANGGTLVTSPNLIFTFSDLMSPRSFVDWGPPAARGFAFDEQWGSVWIPVKGARVNDGDRGAKGVVRLDVPIFGPSSTGRAYRLTWLPGLTNIDGVSVAAQAPVTFVTGASAPGELTPQVGDLRFEWQEFAAGAFTFGGQPVAPYFQAWTRFWDPDAGDSWQLRLTSAAGTATSGWSAVPEIELALNDAQIDGLFPRGETTAFMVTVSDAAGHGVSILHRAYRVSAGFAEQAAPTVAAVGPGVFEISGQVNDPLDAAAIAEMGAFVSIVDTSVYPPNVVEVVGMTIGQVTRNADGTASYLVTTSPERPLPTLPPPFMYMAGALADVPYDLSLDGNGLMVFTAPSAPFNP